MTQKPVLEDPERTRPIVQRMHEHGKKKGQPYITGEDTTHWGIQDEFDNVVGVFKGDVPDNAYVHTDTINHPHVYVTGKVGDNANVASRECEILSAHSIGRNAQMSAGRLLILGDEALSRASLNFTQQWETPLVLVVPEEQRALVFNQVMDALRSPDFPHWSKDNDKHMQALRKILKDCGVTQYRFFSEGKNLKPIPGN